MKNGKPPVIRPGQRVPYHKGTQAEIDQRRGYVARLLARGVPKMAIHSLIRIMFARQWRTVDRDIALITGPANTWLTRARAEYRQTSLPENLAIWWRAYGHGAK